MSIYHIKYCKIQEKSFFFVLSQQQEGEGDDVTESAKKRLGYKTSLHISEKINTVLPTWDLSECCQWMGIWPRCLRVGGQGPICCTENQRRDSTAAVGRGRRSWRPGQQRSWPSGRWLRRHSVARAGCLCAARGRSRHRGKMGLGQESRDKVKN